MNTAGFDFGTTNSLLSIIRGTRAINFLDEEQRPIPSVVCYEGRKTIVGRLARERLAQAGLGIHGNVVRSPKLLLGRDSVYVEGIERSPIDIVADIVRHVLEQARLSRRGPDLGSVANAVVTIPVDMQGGRRRALRDAFRLAGLGIAQFVHEPLAALYGYFRTQGLQQMLRTFNRKLILVFDWGGGTLDLTLCRLHDDQVVQLLNDGTEEVGGDVFDEAIMNRLLQQIVASAGISTEPEVRQGAKARLLDRCERAKIDLSTRSQTQIYVRSFFADGPEEDFDCSLTQDELETIVGPLLDKGFQRIAQLLSRAGYAPEQVALCLATGGMANVPAVQRRLHESFGPLRVQIPDGTATLIAEGAAWIAADGAGLRLAKDVELLLARDSYLTVIRAGTGMPKEGEVRLETVHLYCTDPRDGVAKVQLCVPTQHGRGVLRGQPRIPLETLAVKVDRRARPFRERVELDLRINDDLILEAHARSLEVKDEDRREIHDLEFGLSFPIVGKGGAGVKTLPNGEPGVDRPQSGDGLGLRSDDSVSSTAKDDPREYKLRLMAQEKDRAGASGPDRSSQSFGGLSIRANTADRKDMRLVPGELLYSYDPFYFDTRLRPPADQVHERLYYESCANCERASSDPLCRCR